jgi:hypothetical protein
LFNAPNTLFNKSITIAGNGQGEDNEGDEGEDDDDNVGKGSGSPPSYQTEATFDQKPANLKI